MDNENGVPGSMNERTKKGLEILQAALVMGILGDALLRATPWGLNFFLWVTVLTIGIWVVITRHREEKLTTGTIFLQGALICFAAMFLWRDSIQLMVADVLAVLMILAVLTLPIMKLKIRRSGVVHYALGWLYSGFSCALFPFLLVFGDINWKAIPRGKSSKHLIAIFRGLLVAAPILLIFGALFVAADAAFQDLIEKTFRIDVAAVFNHLLLISLFSWVVGGYFRGAAFHIIQPPETQKTDDSSLSIGQLELKEEQVQNEGSTAETPEPFDLQHINNSFLPGYFTLGTVELGIVLGLMNLLFLSFVIVQIPYLFGGMELVQNTENLKLAEYARRGFGELVWVSALVLPLLLAAHWLIRKDDKTGIWLYRVLAGTQIVLLFVIMLSAAQRMLLYTGNSGYGLTTMRFYPMAFMIWLAVVFVWFAATVLRGRRDHFAWGSLWSGLIFLAVLHVFNPDDFIARTNFSLMHSGRSFDSGYVINLSDDAVPALLEEMPTLDRAQNCLIRENLAERFERGWAETDLRSWNWSRWRARTQLRNSAAIQDLSGCGEVIHNTESVLEIGGVEVAR